MLVIRSGFIPRVFGVLLMISGVAYLAGSFTPGGVQAMKGVSPTERLQELPSGQMCNYKVKLTDANDVDDELIAWIKTAYDAAC